SLNMSRYYIQGRTNIWATPNRWPGLTRWLNESKWLSKAWWLFKKKCSRRVFRNSSNGRLRAPGPIRWQVLGVRKKYRWAHFDANPSPGKPPEPPRRQSIKIVDSWLASSETVVTAQSYANK